MTGASLPASPASLCEIYLKYLIKSFYQGLVQEVIIINNDNIKLYNQFCFPLYACAKEVVRRYRKPLEKLGLTYTQYLVMMVLWEHGGMTESELGKKIRLDSGTLAPLLKRLEKQGYINRIRPENQENKLFLSLTEQGDALRYKAISVPEEMDGCIPLSDEELIVLKNLLDKALVGMDHKA